MPKQPVAKPFRHHHRDGSLWAKGQTVNDVPTGYWEWYRKDGTKLRSGYFEAGRQVGEWITYDSRGEVYKVTEKTPKRATAAKKSAKKAVKAKPRSMRHKSARDAKA